MFKYCFQAYFILGGSLVSEGATWLVAFNSIRRGAKESNMTVKEYSKSVLEYIFIFQNMPDN